jgi:hypothetical protein
VRTVEGACTGGGRYETRSGVRPRAFMSERKGSKLTWAHARPGAGSVRTPVRSRPHRAKHARVARSSTAQTA